MPTAPVVGVCFICLYQPRCVQGDSSLRPGSMHALISIRGIIIMGWLQVSGEGEFFARMVVDAVSRLDPATLDMSMLGIKKVPLPPCVALAVGLRVGRAPP